MFNGSAHIIIVYSRTFLLAVGDFDHNQKGSRLLDESINIVKLGIHAAHSSYWFDKFFCCSVLNSMVNAKCILYIIVNNITV